MMNEDHPTQENVCVEVSMDSQNKMISIMVEEENRVLSVMAVPQYPTRRHHKAPKNGSFLGKMVTKASPSKPSRRAEAFRPMSPVKSRRSSAFYEKSGAPHRRVSVSCPPPTNRRDAFETLRSSSTASSLKGRHHRDTSCPPTLSLLSRGGGGGSTSGREQQRQLREPVVAASNKSRKPNLVAATMKNKRGVLGKSGIKVVPASTQK